MPKRLNNGQRHAISALFIQGWSKKKIYRELKVDMKTVARWTKRNTYTDNARNSLLISDRLKRKLKISVKKGSSIRKTAKNFLISPSTVWKYIRKSKRNPKGIFPYKAKRKLRLSISQKQKRLEYIKKLGYSNQTRLLNNLKKKIIYDEKPFELEGCPNRQNTRFWNEHADIPERYYVKEKHPTTVHCFAAVSFFGKSQLRWYLKDRVGRKGNS
jgi:transposase